jgi:hypothetical protein
MASAVTEYYLEAQGISATIKLRYSSVSVIELHCVMQ